MENVSPEFIEEKVAQGRPYIVAFLKQGATPIENEPSLARLRMAHLQYMFGLMRDGKLLINGPFGTDPVLRGLSIFDSASRDEVTAWMQDDPLVQAGHFRFELYDWFSVPGWGMPPAGVVKDAPPAK